MHKGYMLDTNIFGRILDGNLNLDKITGLGQLHATQIQNFEIKKTKDQVRKGSLKSLLDNLIVIENRLLTNTVLWGDSEIMWGDPRLVWGSGTDLYDKILTKLDSLHRKPNNSADAQIAECAILKNMCLVSCDQNLIKVSQELGCSTFNPDCDII